MRKKILLIILIFITGEECFSQGYSLWLSGNGAFETGYNTSQGAYVFRQHIYFSPNSGESILDTGIYDINNLPVGSRFHAYDTPNFNNVTCDTYGTYQLDKLETVFVGPEANGCSSKIKYYTTHSTNQKINQWAVILPKYVQPQIANRERILTDQLFSSTINNFSDTPVDIPNVRWEYQTDNNTVFWTSFPSNILNKFPMNSTVQEILVNETNPIENIRILRVRFLLSPPLGPLTSSFPFVTYDRKPTVYSGILIFDIFNPSPQLLSFTPSNTQCSYTDDGSFSMNLDRDLNVDEKLVASLFFENAFMPGDYNLLTQKDTEDLIDNGDGTYTYIWPSDTPILAGNYKVRYQTLDTSDPNPVWSSLEGAEMGFPIGNPPPITFSATKQNDVYCKDGSDGAIQLNASGGVGGFKYELNNSGTWTPFTTTNTHTITGLPKGTKTIKVQDANGCTEQE
jgi:hypothetical protein